MLHDENYKRLFASPLMVRDVLRACRPLTGWPPPISPAWPRSPPSTSATSCARATATPSGTCAWAGAGRFCWCLLEFQAQDDRLMALRVLTYTGLLLLELARNQPPEVAGERLPAVLPVVLYNGTEPWTAAPDMGSLITPVGRWLAPYQPAQRYHLIDLQRVAADDLPYRNLLRAVARLEQSRSPQDVMRAVTALQRWLPSRGAEELQRAFADWLSQIAKRMAPRGALVPAIRTLEEASMTLVERVAEWPKQWLREGREQGVAEGREQGRAQGVAEGREQGLTQGVDQQRTLLCRQAAARFDADAAARLADLLAPIADPERLAEVGDWLVRCETAAAFFARFDSASPS